MPSPELQPIAALNLPEVPRSARSMSHQVAARLRTAIVDGTLPPGARILEEDVARQMGVSRGPVRDGLRQLESEGLVISFPNRRTVVAEMSLDEVQSVLLPMRSLIERHAVQTVLPRLRDSDIVRLEQLVDDMHRAAKGRDLAGVVDADIAFHAFLVERSGLTHSARLWELSSPRIRQLFFRMGPRHADLQAIVVQHRALLDVIRTRDLDRVLAAIDEHIADRELFAATVGP